MIIFILESGTDYPLNTRRNYYVTSIARIFEIGCFAIKTDSQPILPLPQFEILT